MISAHFGRLGYNGQSELSSLSLNRNRFFRLLESFDVAANGIFGHVPGVFQVLAFGDQAGQRGDRHRVAAMLISFEESSIFVDFVATVLHFLIIAVASFNAQAYFPRWNTKSSTVISA